MENKERWVGYGVVMALLFAALTLLFALRQGILFPHHRIQVAFPAIGTLMQDDPVKSRGVEVGRVIKISAIQGQAVATLEMYSSVDLPVDTRFINYNYSMFGARMVIMVPGESKQVMDQNVIQNGDFISGVTETIHRVDALLKLVQDYRKLTYQFANGDDSTPSVQKIFTTQIYPALDQFGRFAESMQSLENKTNHEMDDIARTTASVKNLTQNVNRNSDSLILKAQQSLEQLAILTEQSNTLLNQFEKGMASVQDTSQLVGKLFSNRELFDHTVRFSQAVQDFLQTVQKQGFKDVIHFWRNVHIHWNKPKP